MSTWRMSFRAGNQGYEMWPHCLELGVAAIHYSPLVKTDLSEFPKCEPKGLWGQLATSQKASLRRVVYEMKAGDVIYVKQGPKIVGKGIVKGPYQFDAAFRLVEPGGDPWGHQVPVDWALDFQEIEVQVGSEQRSTVTELMPDDIRRLETAIDKATASIQQQEALEGEAYKKEANFRKRNRALIQAKKANSDYRCEVCEFNFEERYGVIGRKYIVAHHLEGIASGPRRTTLEDIALVCANCHAMVHMENPPISLEKLRRAMARQKKAEAS
jgi:hypothetical protein